MSDEARGGGFSPHSVRLAWLLALAYLLVIAYASLQPFRGWHMPPAEVLRFLGAPWPHYITLRDVAINVAAYLPLGFLLSIGCGARLGPGRGVIVATLAAAAASLVMEAAQMFLPTRIASNVDLLANASGALIGAMAAPLFAPTRIVGSRVHALRHRLFRDGMTADVGLVIVCLWLLTQLHPTAQLFGTGGIRATFELPAYFAHTPLLALSGEATVALLNLTGIGLLISTLVRGGREPMPLIGTAIVAALAVKAVAAALLRSSAPLAWLTPGVSFGLLAGWALLYGAVRLPQAVRPALAALCILAATVAINLAPDNPYQSVPPQLVARGPSYFLSFSGVVRALSELWPLLAVGYLAWALAARTADAPSAAMRGNHRNHL